MQRLEVSGAVRPLYGSLGVKGLANKMHYFVLTYFNNKPLRVSSKLTAHNQEDQLCINSYWYSHVFM